MQISYEILNSASKKIELLKDVSFDVITIGKPQTLEEAINNTKIISKLSPLMGNLIEFKICTYLNVNNSYHDYGYWKRQDPGFPDTVFQSSYISPTPGIEIKAWFPLSTEITARFKDSQDHFIENQINVALVCWIPRYIVYGEPVVIDSVVVSAQSIAQARDNHYSDPPRYLIVEPGDTSDRTLNLRQSNTNGYIFQGNDSQFEEASLIFKKWNEVNEINSYSTDTRYQFMVNELMSKFPYRLDTNFAKIDRIKHCEIEKFKSRVLNKEIYGRSLIYWARMLSKGSVDDVKRELSSTLGLYLI